VGRLGRDSSHCAKQENKGEYHVEEIRRRAACDCSDRRPGVGRTARGQCWLPVTASTTVNKPAVKHAKLVKHFRRHVVRHNVGKTKMARHFKSTKAPRHHIAAPLVKHPKLNKTSKIMRSNKSLHS
jgi:hypothetical protein